MTELLLESASCHRQINHGQAYSPDQEGHQQQKCGLQRKIGTSTL